MLRGGLAARRSPRSHPSSAVDDAPPPQSEGGGGGDRTVKALKLSKALTISEGTPVAEACRRMAHRKVDAALLTDSNGLLSGIVTDKDVAVRVIAEGLRPDQTIMSKIMTRNPIYVGSDTLAIEELQKMVQGKFRHLPVVENGEVIGMLDITKCLFDAIRRMEKVAEQGSTIADAVEGVERQWGSKASVNYAFIEALRNRMFKPSLSTIIMENTKLISLFLHSKSFIEPPQYFLFQFGCTYLNNAISRLAVMLPSDPVYLATKKMRDHRVNSVIISSAGKPHGILTSKDVLMRVVAHNLSPELTLVEKVMTANPECATTDTTILDALHTMHNGKFLHLPVVDKDGRVIACLDVLQITHAATSMVEGGSGAVDDMTSTLMQKFWDSVLALDPPEDEYETRSELSALMASEMGETIKSVYPPLGLGNSFYFKIQDQRGRMHRFSCGAESLSELLASVKERLESDIDLDGTQVLYEDDEGDKILLLTDSDLLGAVHHARLTGLKVLRLHIEKFSKQVEGVKPLETQMKQTRLTYLHVGVLTGAVLLTGAVVLVYLKRSTL